MRGRWGRWLTGTVSALVIVAASGCTMPGVKMGPGVKKGPHGTSHLPFLEPERLTPSVVELEPADACVPVGTTHLMVATVRDDAGRLVRGARIEWVVVAGSVGGIVAVDDGSGHVRRRREAVRAAATTTSRRVYDLEHDERSDRIGEGETWCLVAGGEVGDTELLVYSPDVPNRLWGEVRVVRSWVDVRWEWPLDAESAPGTPHTFTTRVLDARDGRPRAGYRVTYELFDGGPSAVFDGGERRAETTTDAVGVASATLRQTHASRGWNDLRVSVAAPTDAHGTPGRVLATHIVRKTWRGE